MLGDTYAISPSTLNSFHFTFGRKAIDRAPNSKGINPLDLGVQNFYVYPLATDNLQVAVSNGGFTTGGSGFSHWGVNSFQEADDVDILRGRHQIGFGVDILRTQDNQNDQYNDSGTFSFSGLYSHDPLLDFLTGSMNNFTQTLPQDYSYRQTLVALYAQDTIRLTPKLVANIGLRWEPTLPSHDYFNRGSVFSLPRLRSRPGQHRFSQCTSRSILLWRPWRQQVIYRRPLAKLLSRVSVSSTTLMERARPPFASVQGFSMTPWGPSSPTALLAQNPPWGRNR